MAYSGPAFGTVGHLLTNAYSSADYYECITVSSTHYFYRKRDANGFASSGHNIKYYVTGEEWQDGSGSSWPVFFGATNTNGASSIVPTGTATILHLFDTNYLFSVITNLPGSSSGGGGSSSSTTSKKVYCNFW